jgi:hypothetical protein
LPSTTWDTDRALPPFTYLLSKSNQHLKLDHDDPEKSVPKADLGIGIPRQVIVPSDISARLSDCGHSHVPSGPSHTPSNFGHSHATTESSDYTMTDLATFLTQLYRHAHSMENIVKAIYIPDNITQAGHSHCKEYLDKALEHMIIMGDTFGSISAQHPQDLLTQDVQTASASFSVQDPDRSLVGEDTGPPPALHHELVGLREERAC